MTKKTKSTDHEKGSVPDSSESDGVQNETVHEIPIIDGSQKKPHDSAKRESIQEKPDEAETKAAEYLGQLQRLQAEFSNYRKRTEKEKQSLRDWLHGQMVLDLLPVLDDLNRLLLSHDNRKECDIEGVKLIQQKFQKTLKEKGLEEIESVGQEFNPDVHEAVSVEHTDEKNAGRVLEEWEKGYRIGEKLLRPSRVKVGKAKEKAGDGST